MDTDMSVDACVRRIADYFGSRMCHKGRGWEGCRDFGLGEEFRNAYYTVDVEEEVTRIGSAIAEAVQADAEVTPSLLEVVTPWLCLNLTRARTPA